MRRATWGEKQFRLSEMEDPNAANTGVKAGIEADPV